MDIDNYVDQRMMIMIKKNKNKINNQRGILQYTKQFIIRVVDDNHNDNGEKF